MQGNHLYVLLAIWILSGLCIVFEKRLYRIVVYFCIFSLLSSVVYLFLNAPDVAIAEAGISAFIIVFAVIFIGKYYENMPNTQSEANVPKGSIPKRLLALLVPICFTAGLFALFVFIMPDITASDRLSAMYLDRFMADVGGENAVAAILLVYRVYDTLFEALVLVVAVVAVLQMSHFSGSEVEDCKHCQIVTSSVAALALRVVGPLIILFGGYLAINGHISAGGGFQGGLAVAAFFICRYMIYRIEDISVSKVMRLEEMIFISIIILSALAVFLGVAAILPSAYLPIFQVLYLVLMNTFIGLKVACGFFLLFYRFIAVEGR